MVNLTVEKRKLVKSQGSGQALDEKAGYHLVRPTAYAGLVK